MSAESPTSSQPTDWTEPHVPWLRRTIRRVVTADARYTLRLRVIDTPVLSEWFTKMDPAMANSRVVPGETRIVIDGFPRSANSYSRSAFQFANGFDLPISTHGHSHRFAELGVKHGIPVITLIREPRAPLASILQFTREVSPHALVRSWIRYYEGILPIADRVVLATFEEVTGDFGAVIDRVNAKYGTSFTRYEKTPDNDAAVAAQIERETREVIGPEHFEAVVPRPSTQRGTRESALSSLDARTLAELDKATALYERLLQIAGKQAR